MSYQNQVLGTIISSVLNYDQLCKVMVENPAIDNTKSSYVPCDGRKIEHSKLSELTGVLNVPDLRGRFLRGLNLIYSVGQPDLILSKADQDDPTNSRKPGDYQPDAYKQHSHNYTHFDGGIITDMSNDKDQRRCSYGNMVGATTAVSGDSVTETRPKNVSVYFYIKIN